MKIELSHHTRLALLTAVLGLAVLGSGLILIGRFHSSGGGSDSAAPVHTPVRTPAPVVPTHVKPTVTKPATHVVAKPHTHVVRKTPVHHVVPRAAHRPLAADGLPALPREVAQALSEHRIVVVFLTAPNVKIDQQAFLEAQAGAQDAHAAFAAVDVTSSDIDSLTARYSILHDPAVLVLKPPAALVIRLDGFADRATVAQAATSARRR